MGDSKIRTSEFKSAWRLLAYACGISDSEIRMGDPAIHKENPEIHMKDSETPMLYRLR